MIPCKYYEHCYCPHYKVFHSCLNPVPIYGPVKAFINRSKSASVTLSSMGKVIILASTFLLISSPRICNYYKLIYCYILLCFACHMRGKHIILFLFFRSFLLLLFPAQFAVFIDRPIPQCFPIHPHDLRLFHPYPYPKLLGT